MSEQVSDVIARADSKGKIIDFRNNLVQARSEHYGMMHGCGGKNFAPNSTIKIFMTDYSEGTGDKSVKADANVTPDTIARMLEVCSQNIGEVYLPTPVSTKASGDALEFARKLGRAARPCDGAKDMIQLRREDLNKLGSLIAAVHNGIEAVNTNMSQPVRPNVNFSLKQERVNIYQQGNDGFVPVSSLLITRQGIRKDGQVSKNPWTVKITNFRAKPLPQANGTTAFDGKTAKEKKEVYIMISDPDMYRCCYRVQRFIETWENTNCIPAIQSALMAKEQARQEANAYR